MTVTSLHLLSGHPRNLALEKANDNCVGVQMKEQAQVQRDAEEVRRVEQRAGLVRERDELQAQADAQQRTVDATSTELHAVQARKHALVLDLKQATRAQRERTVPPPAATAVPHSNVAAVATAAYLAPFRLSLSTPVGNSGNAERGGVGGGVGEGAAVVVKPPQQFLPWASAPARDFSSQVASANNMLPPSPAAAAAVAAAGGLRSTISAPLPTGCAPVILVAKLNTLG